MTETLVARLTTALAGRYAIERELGQGGMATVYLARDLRHDRKVALKVLRPELAAVIGADRFLQEIRVTAGLQHPHILPLHDSGEIDHFLYYVMPYVEGESLRDRLLRERQLSIEDALRIAAEVLAALAYAHGRGVIHRDIKPENILLAHGAAVVADFGIARAVTAAGGGRLTETGLSLGTPQYMSPEQATADRELDGRSDVYALGAVLYELLTGEPPHTGPTTQSVIAKLLTEEPRPVLAGRPTVPPHVAAAVHKALARLPADRFKGAAEFAEALARPGAFQPAAPAPAPRTAARQARLLLPLAGMLLLGVALLFGALLRPSAPEAPAPVVRAILKLPANAGLQALVSGSPLVLSPDASTLVYAGRQQLFVRRLDQLDPVPLPNTNGASQPFLSPDGQRVGFLADGSLKQVALAGGPVVTLCPVQDLWGASWGSRDEIVYSASGRLFRIAASGGTPRPIPLVDSTPAGSIRWPEFLPDGKRVLVTRGFLPMIGTAIVELETGKLTLVPEAGINPRFIEPGYLVSFSAEGSASVMPFDWRQGRVTGPATPVLEGMSIGLQGVAEVAISRSGWVVYAPAVSSRRRLVLVNRRGAAALLPTEARTFSDPRFSPDGKRVVVTQLVPGGGLAGDIWVLDLGQQTLSRLTFEGQQQFPEWTADGKRVLFTARGGGRAGIHWIPAAGGEMDSLLPGTTGLVLEGILTRDQRTMVYRIGGIPADLYVVRRDSLKSPHPLVVSRFDERSPALSPDERWIAYVSNESGRDEVYVRQFPSGGGRWLVSAAGGTEPRWRRDGRELFYRNADSLFAVPVPLQRDFAIGRRALLFTGNYLSNGRHATYDVHPDGNQFIFISGETDNGDELVLVQNLVASVARKRGR
jgi:eukaryotic-like serine/threonine-protein kinase